MSDEKTLENNLDTSTEKAEEENSKEETIKTEEKKQCNKCKEYEEKFLRTAAEYENYRKRSEKEKEAIYSDALSFAVLGILPVMDSLEAAEDSLKNHSEEYTKGIKLLSTKFKEALKNLNVEAFGSVGEKFDPSIHNAISHIEEENDKQNEISKVFQKGYKSKNRIIRHAMVQVTN